MTSKTKSRAAVEGDGRKRLSKQARHDQLLAVALAIVQREGSDALTLGHLAERAGVSKPIAYEHFETRAGLLVALARHIDTRQLAVLEDALGHAGRNREDIARVAAAAYVRCYATAGAEWVAIVAALKGSEELEGFEAALIDSYVAILQGAFAPFTQLSPRELRLRCTAIVGAADAIARQMLRGAATEAEAEAATAALMLGAIPPGPPPRARPGQRAR